MNVRELVRLAMLAVAIGIGTAVASAPGIACADGLDFQISIDGYDLFPVAGNTATATSGVGDIAIAFGNANAVAEGGFGDFALADGTGISGAQAIAGDTASGATGNNFDFASAFGNGSGAQAGDGTGTFFPNAVGSSFDVASAEGTTSQALAGFNGSGDSAYALGDNTSSLAGFSSGPADPANYDSASVFASLFTATSGVNQAIAGGDLSGFAGNNDIAFVDNLFGTVGSTAIAGLGNNFDLAGALGDSLASQAFGSEFLAHILPFF